jgi:GNAT superfamily N-acetyltransferase
MAFAPEDKRAWRDSEIMAEFEKVALETSLLDGGPPEAFQPIHEKVATEQNTWEDEDIQELPTADLGVSRHAELAGYGAQLMETIEKMAQDLAEVGRVRAAYRLERTLAALKDITNIGGE